MNNEIITVHNVKNINTGKMHTFTNAAWKIIIKQGGHVDYTYLNQEKMTTGKNPTQITARTTPPKLVKSPGCKTCGH